MTQPTNCRTFGGAGAGAIPPDRNGRTGVAEGGVTAAIAQVAEFFPQAGGVLATLAPPLVQIARVLIQEFGSSRYLSLLEEFPDMPATVIAERIGWMNSLTVGR